jgi:hypothetical protein
MAREHLRGSVPRRPILEDPRNVTGADSALPQDPLYMMLREVVRASPIAAFRAWLERRSEARAHRRQMPAVEPHPATAVPQVRQGAGPEHIDDEVAA